LNRFVLDASIALAWCFEDEDSDGADEILDHLASAEAIVPVIWPAEVGNALLAAERRKRMTAAGVSRSLGLLGELNIQVDAASTHSSVGDVVALARSAKLSVYDASYLFLAMREGIPLATLDLALGEAARKAGVAVLPATSGSGRRRRPGPGR
jgi:predicted nucleic acid-binding protein